jgi:hypothetical protein
MLKNPWIVQTGYREVKKPHQNLKETREQKNKAKAPKQLGTRKQQKQQKQGLS